jgi:hypothetical protein
MLVSAKSTSKLRERALSWQMMNFLLLVTIFFLNHFVVCDLEFNVTNNRTRSYIINGEVNPSLTLTTGSYKFNVNAEGHPFWIKTVRGTCDDTPDCQKSAFPGVQQNGIEVGVISLTIPPNTNTTVFYNCEFHPLMEGVIIIQPPTLPPPTLAPTSAPTSTPTSSLPTESPTPVPPTLSPTPSPTAEPTPSPTAEPTSTPTPPNHTFVVTNDGSRSYIIDNQTNPDLTLLPGTYVFQVNAKNHPFWIKTVPGTCDEDQCAKDSYLGTRNNGAQIGDILLTIPENSTIKILYYNCEYHTPMAGVINIGTQPNKKSFGIMYTPELFFIIHFHFFDFPNVLGIFMLF